MKSFFFNNRINFSFLLISISYLVYFIGIENISFKSIEWLYNGEDASLHQSGWYFFKNDVWRFPLGSNPNYGEGFGSSIVYTDSIPFFALIFKLLKSFISDNFQYFSFWYLTTLYLQLFVSFKILKKYTKSDAYSFIGSLFFIISPFFIYRFGLHASVSAHWILLTSLYLGFTYQPNQSKLPWLALIIFSSLVNYSFTAMLLLFYFLLRIFNFFYEKNFLRVLKDFVIIIITLLLTLYIVGYFEIRMADTLGVGFGIYKFNLLSIFDSVESVHGFNSSWILPDIKLSIGEELEGFNYIGIGSIIMFIIILGFSFNKSHRKKIFYSQNKRNVKIISLILVFFTLWALSNKISFGLYTLIDIPLNKYFLALLSIAKNSGRMFWIVNYFILISFLLIIFKTFDKKKSLILIALIFIIQLIDTSPVINSRINKNKLSIESNIKDGIWHSLFEKYKIVKTTNPKSWSPLFTSFSYMMEEYNVKKTNLVIQGRAHRKAIAETRYSLYKDLRDEKLNSETLYIIDGLAHLRHLKYIYKNNEKVGFFYGNGFWSIAHNEKKRMRSSDFKKLEKIELKLLEINKQENINIKNEDSYFGLGWSHNGSKEGIWSDGPISSLLFKVNKNYGDLELEIFCTPYIAKKNKFLEFDVYINDFFVQKIELKKNKNGKSVKILIKENYIKNNKVKVDLNFKNLTSPLDELKSPDSRKLGILVKYISIKPI
jgi:hypothetical protein